MEAFGSLVKFCNGVLLLRLQALNDHIEVRNFCQQKPHIGEVVGVCKEAEDVFNVFGGKDSTGLISLNLQPSLNAKDFAHLNCKVLFMWL